MRNCHAGDLISLDVVKTGDSDGHSLEITIGRVHETSAFIRCLTTTGNLIGVSKDYIQHNAPVFDRQ